ncbi:hypothetical protein [Streptomyces zingiberis]|uniref:Uncharacterized protein n=1 Tax=Streptomyces zingiberis TaxID=2053010 RepID=A0ABX1BRA3_9ACTN|nr:hypothetical protein [Streptomyces zingiberis]NJP99104.1 hypothetical protein [Streptomyces zingiberis]
MVGNSVSRKPVAEPQPAARSRSWSASTPAVCAYRAKTGSAEADGQATPNGWFTASRGGVAAAGLVLHGGHGGDSAGPIVAAVLKAP